MTIKELKLLLSEFPDDMEVVLNLTNEEETEGFWLCPLAKVEEIETDMEEKYIMLTGLEYHATTELSMN